MPIYVGNGTKIDVYFEFDKCFPINVRSISHCQLLVTKQWTTTKLNQFGAE